jgi:kynureninase
VPSLFSARAGYEIVASLGVPAIRARSLMLTRRLIDAARAAGFRLNTPTDDRERGGTVVLDVSAHQGPTRSGQAIADELIRRGVIIDYRPSAGIRVAPHFYNTEQEIDHAMQTLEAIVGSSA